VLDPQELYELAPDLPELDGPVLVHGMTGFIDAGAAGRLAGEHLLESLEHRVLATFDVDQLLDYRSRRPVMTFVEDHFADYATPQLALHLVQDSAGQSFLFLAGPEPDLQWDRFIAAVGVLVELFGVRLTVGLNAIPMAVPHTRPTGLTAHATRPELVAGHESWVGTVAVPASVGALLELRLGESGYDAAGFAVHVPHYLSQAEYPDAAEALLDAVARISGLDLPSAALRSAAERTRTEIDEQVGRSEEVAAVVHALEQQYDAYLGARRPATLLADRESLPSADELGAEFERYLASQEGDGDSTAG
jgi:predicted ATP-grasp superfamily ATP-dependent carboligase